MYCFSERENRNHFASVLLLRNRELVPSFSSHQLKKDNRYFWCFKCYPEKNQEQRQCSEVEIEKKSREDKGLMIWRKTLLKERFLSVKRNIDRKKTEMYFEGKPC